MPSLLPLRRFAACALLVAAGVTSAVAVPTLYYSPAQTTNGYATGSSSAFTNAINNAFGTGNIFQVTDFSNAASFANASAIVINARGQNPTALSLAEQTNILNFINQGGATFFIGDHSLWQTWDNSFLGLFGDHYTPWNSAVGAALATNALPAHFTPGTQIGLSGPGAIAGGHGTPLYQLHAFSGTYTVASVYGPNANAIAFLDTNAFGNANNTALFNGIGSWAHAKATAYETAKANANPPASVPEAGPGVLLPLVLLGLAVGRRLARRA